MIQRAFAAAGIPAAVWNAGFGAITAPFGPVDGGTLPSRSSTARCGPAYRYGVTVIRLTPKRR